MKNISEIIMPNLVWSPGRTAEAIRTAAVACLCSALQDDPETELVREQECNGDKDKVGFVSLTLFGSR